MKHLEINHLIFFFIVLANTLHLSIQSKLSYLDYFLILFFQFGSKEGYLTKLGGKIKVRICTVNSKILLGSFSVQSAF